MRKRFVSTLVVLTLAVGLCFAQGAKRKVELEYFSLKPEAVPVMEKLIARFMGENPDIAIKLTATPDAPTVLRTRVASNDVPDIFNSFPAERLYKSFFDEGIIMDLTGQPFLGNVSEGTIKTASYNGRIFALPVTLSVYGIYYRKDLFAKHGLTPPSNYAELIDVAKKLKARGITPFSFANKDLGNIAQRTERLLGVVNNDIDGEFRRIARGEIKVENSPSLRAFANMMVEITSYGSPDSLAVDYESSMADVVNGKAAMTISGTWALGTMRTSNPNIDVELIPFPNPAGKTNVPVNIDTSYSISATTKNKEASLKFLAFLSRTDNGQIYADLEKSPNMIKGVQYSVEPHQKMVGCLEAGNIYITAINFWPIGLREELRTPVQQLIMDSNVDAFLRSAGRAIAKYYK